MRRNHPIRSFSQGHVKARVVGCWTAHSAVAAAAGRHTAKTHLARDVGNRDAVASGGRGDGRHGELRGVGPGA